MSTQELIDLLKQASAEYAEADDVSYIYQMNANIDKLESRLKSQLEQSRDNVTELETDLIETERSLNGLRELMKDATEEATIMRRNDKVTGIVDELQKLESEIKDLNMEIEEKVTKLANDDNDRENGNAEIDIIKQEVEQEYDPVFAANILKLKLYRSLGVRLDLENGQILIQNKESGGIDTLPLESDLTDHFIVKYIWDRIGKSETT
ncbi:Kinetochore protein SPC24 [Nakaseomyces bracarensis]|uniref:Kinetochore protein Spc24 n=1 Tax=Nakaseomyces bracarensis TaxID=273131 RepID=A0ABR4NV20_9SACH